MATTMVNGGPSGTEGNSTNIMPNAGKQDKPAGGATNSKNVDSSRKLAGTATPNDGSQR